MNYDEFAFFNHQLAGMLRSGIHLEGALAQLSRNMRRGGLQQEISLLEDQLKQGVPLETAVSLRQLPQAYIQMVRAGAQAQNLPGILTLIADYYSSLHTLRTRLKGLMVYPVIVLAFSFVISLFLSLTFWVMVREAIEAVQARSIPPSTLLFYWAPPAAFLVALLALVAALSSKRLRDWLRWKLPGVKDAAIAQTASTLAALLSTGTSLEVALRLVAEAEGGSPGARDLALWRANLLEGKGKFPAMSGFSPNFPPLFVWLVAQSGENLEEGFRKAAHIYGERARHRTDMLLYAALPLAVVGLGAMIVGQTISVMGFLISFLDTLGGM